MADLLRDKCAVVTGGGRGQGREIALAMAREGVKVVVNDLGGGVEGIGSDQAPADEVTAEINRAGGTAVANYDNVADFNAAKNIIDDCVNNFGRIDILVNCAGILGRIRTPFYEIDKEDWDRVMAVNLHGTFHTCRHALRFMMTQKTGRIINFSSPAWLGMRATAYAASKGAVVSMTVGIAQQMILEGYEITCNAIVPIAETRMSPRAGGEFFKRLYQEGLINQQLCEESCDPPGPEHIPPVVLYLATDEAVNINGQVIGASRGRVALYSYPSEIKGLYKDGLWTLEELVDRVPATFAQGLQRMKG